MQVRAVLFDRDGTLIEDVPYNGDPARVTPVPGAREVLDNLRRSGIALGIVSNQSGIGRGYITAAQADEVNARVVELLGPFGVVLYCPHGPDDGCACRKPQPKLLFEAAAALGVPIASCVMVGDKADDMEAARRAGMLGIRIDRGTNLVHAVERIKHLLEE